MLDEQLAKLTGTIRGQPRWWNASCSPDQATYTSLRYGNDQDDTAVWLNGHGCHRGYTIVIVGVVVGVILRVIVRIIILVIVIIKIGIKVGILVIVVIKIGIKV